jgi:hypothetical protein
LEWTFEADGVVKSTNGDALMGKWKVEKEKKRVLILWDDVDAWESMNLPLDPKTTYGRSCHNPGWLVIAVKQN